MFFKILIKSTMLVSVVLSAPFCQKEMDFSIFEIYNVKTIYSIYNDGEVRIKTILMQPNNKIRLQQGKVFKLQKVCDDWFTFDNYCDCGSAKSECAIDVGYNLYVHENDEIYKHIIFNNIPLCIPKIAKPYTKLIDPAQYGTIVSLQGIVRVKKEHGQWIKARKNMILETGDRIKTLSNAKVHMKINGHLIKIDRNTQLIIGEKENHVSLYHLFYGVIMAQSNKKKESMKISTPHSITGTRGTQFEITSKKNKDCVKVYDGSVIFNSRKNKTHVIVRAHQESCLNRNGHPSFPKSFK